jgi:hypothetical protein
MDYLYLIFAIDFKLEVMKISIAGEVLKCKTEPKNLRNSLSIGKMI